MIRHALFKNIAQALRDSLNDAEAASLGMWLLMSAGVYVSRSATFSKDDAHIEEMEKQLEKYIFPENTTVDEAISGGSFAEHVKYEAANRLIVQHSIDSLHNVIYNITESFEREDHPDLGPPQEDPRFANAVPTAPVPAWFNLEPHNAVQVRMVDLQARMVLEDLVERAGGRPVLIAPPVAPVERGRAAEEVVRTEGEALQWGREAGRDRLHAAARVLDGIRLDELAHRTRGIPNRR